MKVQDMVARLSKMDPAANVFVSMVDGREEAEDDLFAYTSAEIGDIKKNPEGPGIVMEIIVSPE